MSMLEFWSCQVRRATGAGFGLLLLAGCSFDVTNPGPVGDEFLDQANAYPATVNGAGRNLAEAINWIGYTGAAVARELNPAGSTGSFGITPAQQAGELRDDEVNTHWAVAHQARYVAEIAIERMTKASQQEAVSPEVLAQAYLWAGYANRLLGENMCQAVFEGGAPQPSSAYLERAEGQFTRAMEIAQGVTGAAGTQIRTAATAGRASVRLFLGDYAGAAADAGAVPAGFVFAMPYYNNEQDVYNRIYWASANQPYRAHTVWNTYYEDYYRTTRDPRVPWDSSATVKTGDAAIPGLGRVPWYFQTKYKQVSSPINLSTGREMRLIEAEVMLRDGNVQGAMDVINGLRTAAGVTPWPAVSSAEEAWTRLKRERGIELWLEARRLGDLRRWMATNTPGETDDMAGRSTCFPISRAEKETNPNIPS